MTDPIAATQETMRLFFGSALVAALGLSPSGCAAEQQSGSGPVVGEAPARPVGEGDAALRQRADPPPTTRPSSPSKPAAIRVGRDPSPEAALPAGALEAAIPYDGFRACYTAAQEQDPTLRGRVELRAKIAADGAVASVQVTALAGLSAAVVGCVTSRLEATRFPPPDAGHDTLILPIEFEPKP